MKKISNQEFVEERSLFKGKNLKIENCHFDIGESPLKESENIEMISSSFAYKYPLWYAKNIKLTGTTFHPLSRSGIWYTKNIEMRNCIVDAPKEFRRSKKILIENCRFPDAQEMLWSCDRVEIKNALIKGDYLLMNSKNIKIDNLHLEGNYLCDGAENVEITNSVLHTKDAFWNCKNVVLRNCKIVGEYFGWNSKNVTLIDCDIESHQGFCYMDKLIIRNSKIYKSDFIFEFSNVDVQVTTKIDSIKNPYSGTITCKGYGELILDETVDASKTTIIVEG